MAPVFSLVLDRDLNEGLALSYPELYKELTKVRLPSRVSSLLLFLYAHFLCETVCDDLF
jgi:phospholipid-translocating ATPase